VGCIWASDGQDTEDTPTYPVLSRRDVDMPAINDMSFKPCPLAIQKKKKSEEEEDFT